MNIKKALLTLLAVISPMIGMSVKAQDVRQDHATANYGEYVSNIDPYLNMQIPALLNASRDPFGNAAAYNLSSFRYRMRGLDAMYTRTMVNGIDMTDMNSGFMQWGLWGGLNDATRNQMTTLGLSPAEYGVGNLGGTQDLDFRASAYRPGTRLTYSNSNRSYRHRLMVSTATGVTADGWAAMASASLRLGQRGYVQGTFYDARGFFLSLEKKLGDHHALTFVALTAPTSRGVMGGSTQEVYDLVGDNHYNPNIGYQNGKLRNARVRESNEPVLFLTHDWTINSRNKLSTTVMFRTGYNGYSAMNWIGQDPRPDYYRNLPSYYDGVESVVDRVAEAWKSRDPSVMYINFDQMLRANANNTTDIKDDQGQVVHSGKRAIYIIEDRRNDQRQISMASTLHSDWERSFHFDGGLRFAANKTSNFTAVKDLLGADFWYDVDKFAERDFADAEKAMSDLLNPYRIAREGDRFGYDYDTYVYHPEAWGVLNHSARHFDSYIALELGQTIMYREGRMQKGLFPDNSFGRSDILKYFDYNVKVGTTYKLSGHHYFRLNMGLSQQAPYIRNAFMSARTRNSVIDGLTAEHAVSAEGSYFLRTPFVKARLTGFFTRISDKSKVISFYDDSYRAFGQYVMTGIQEQYVGFEGGVEWKISPTVSFTAAGSVGDYFYNSNPSYQHYVDNTEKLLGAGTVYWQNFKISGTPQQVASVGLTYNSPHFWFCGITGNYAGRSYISMNPTLRTLGNIEMDGYQPEYFSQETFGDYVTLDAFFGKSWSIAHKYRLALNVNISNILDNKAIRTGGYEQMRNRYIGEGPDMKFVKPFDKKYFYAYGLNYFANLMLSW